MRGAGTRLAIYPFEAALALAGVWTGLVRLLRPETRGVVEAAVSPLLSGTWMVSYAASGALILLALAINRRNLEAAALIWLAGALAINVYAAVATLGGARVVQSPTLLMLAAACLLRVARIIRHPNVVVIDRDRP